MKAGRALIIGGLLGGLSAANLLHGIGRDVESFERVADDLATRGAGMATHDERFASPRRLGVVIDDTISIKISKNIFCDCAGKVVATLTANCHMSSWVRFYRRLKEMLPQAFPGIRPGYAGSVARRAA